MRRKHGDINEQTGMVFWAYDCDGRERWFDPARYLFQCNRAAINRKSSYWKNPEKSRARLREYHHKNKQIKSKCFKNWATKNKSRIRGSRLLRTYGITQEKYDQMFLEQRGLCAICNLPQHGKKSDGSSRMLCVDHCHKTKRVRRLLCTKCNTGIGQFEDSPERLQAAILYLKQHAPANMGGMDTQNLSQ